MSLLYLLTQPLATAHQPKRIQVAKPPFSLVNDECLIKALNFTECHSYKRLAVDTCLILFSIFYPCVISHYL